MTSVTQVYVWGWKNGRLIGTPTPHYIVPAR